jgi:hypothetical protein
MGGFREIPKPPEPKCMVGAGDVQVGMRFPPQQQILLYSPEQWEAFIEEWAYFCLKERYKAVRRFAGAGDRGIDIAGFADAQRLQGVWDNYQCKHYDKALTPTVAWPEIGKILWYSCKKEYKPPRQYFFVAPYGAGTTLTALLADAGKLKRDLIANWDKYCRKTITSTEEISLEGEFLDYVNAFDFSIFDSKTALELVNDHRSTRYHAMRFGGGLPPRPMPANPPEGIAGTESRYVEELLKAYSEHKRTPIPDAEALKPWPRLREHFGRQRVAFYHAESLRIYARESVPLGVFEALQEEIYTGVIDTHDAEHPDGYQRVLAVTKAARELQITSNALITQTRPQDRDGMCHQLANDSRLQWTKR